MSGVMFGAFIPQGWKQELASMGGVEEQWATTIDVAVRAEELGSRCSRLRVHRPSLADAVGRRAGVCASCELAGCGDASGVPWTSDTGGRSSPGGTDGAGPCGDRRVR